MTDLIDNPAFLTTENIVKIWEQGDIRSNIEFWHVKWNWCEKSKIPKILDCETCFEKFLYEYSVGRGMNSKARRKVRKRLKTDFRSIESAEKKYEKMEELSGKKFANQIRRSLYSKIAAFAWPDQQVPMDSLNVAGIIRLRNAERYTTDFPSPRQSLSKFGTCVETIKRDKNAISAIHEVYQSRTDIPDDLTEKAFECRIIDGYLMALGGWKASSKDFLGCEVPSPQGKKIVYGPQTCCDDQKNRKVLPMDSA